MPTVRRMKAKLVLMGEGGVGKTSLIRRFVINEYQDTYLHTVGTKVSKIELTVPRGPDLEIHVDMSIFDIMGQHGFHELIKETYFHGAQALLGVCDITRQDSLDALSGWIASGREVAGEVPAYIVVNKKDLVDRRAITDEDVQKVADSFGAPWAMTSAKTGEFVDDVFNALAVEIVDRALQAEAQAGEQPLREKILRLLAKRGSMGLKRNQFFGILRGVGAEQLQRELEQLEKDRLIDLAWTGPGDFTATVTERGIQASRGTSAPLEE